MFLGCVTLFQTSSCRFVSYDVVDDDGYVAVRVEVNATGEVTLKLFDPSDKIVEEKQLDEGLQIVTLDLGGYHEMPSSGSYTLRAYGELEDVVAEKRFVVSPPSLSISGFSGEWWKEGMGSYSLIEVVLSVKNTGNVPVYLKKMNVTVDGSTFSAFIFDGVVEGGETKEIAASFYIPDLADVEHGLTVDVFDFSGGMMASERFSDKPFYDSSMRRFTLNWKYKWRSYSVTLPLPEKLFGFCSSMERPLVEDYSFYVISPYDDGYVDMVTEKLTSLFNGEGEELINFIASFVQSIPYEEESGEYPQFPVELLFNGSGDCEDKAIFASSILYNLGYDVALLRFPEHMAVGVHLPDAIYDGRVYYEDSFGKRYLFLETSNTVWMLGNADLEYKHVANFTLYHVVSKPVLVQECEPPTRYTSVVEDYVEVETAVSNIGTADADDV
ncbi:MAG TPA: hypothetical protein ENI42_04515, partial [Thermoplasmatales archaeon]|nr:hypothetical protein [Thermoplasmatales archaeon]